MRIFKFYNVLAISMINVCLADDYSNQPHRSHGGYGVYFPAPDLTNVKVYDPSQSVYKALEAERRRKEVQRIELQNQMLQQEMRERERQRHNRNIEERRQQKLLKEKRQAETKKQTEQGKDIYAELIKLDELKQKGIITEEEFEIQKKKILSRDNTYAGIEKSNKQKSCETQCAEKFNNGELVKGAGIKDCINVLCRD